MALVARASSPRPVPSIDEDIDLPDPFVQDEAATRIRMNYHSPICTPARGATTGAGLLAVAVATFVATHFFGRAEISTTAAFIGGAFACFCLENQDHKVRKVMSNFLNKWSAHIQLAITQGDLQCVAQTPRAAALFCSTVQKETVIILQMLGVVWVVSSIANRLRRTNAKRDDSSLPLLQKPPYSIKMLEPTSPASFWITKIAKGGTGTALFVMAKLHPQLNFLDLMDDLGIFWVGDAAGTIAARGVLNIWSRLEVQQKNAREEGLNPPPPSTLLKVFRIGAAVSEGLSLNVVGALFVGVPLPEAAQSACFGVAGAIIGTTDFVAKHRFTHLTLERLDDLRKAQLAKPYSRAQTLCKVSLSAITAGYLEYGYWVSPIPAKGALLSFWAGTCLSYLAASWVDRQFFRHPNNRIWATLAFYLVKSPHWIPLPFIIITQQVKIGNYALLQDPLTLTLVSCTAYFSLGASLGQVPARHNSPLILTEARSAPEIAQYLVGRVAAESLTQGNPGS
ncbi:MAG: hypothetical protein JSS10_01255 [Verrucomicrobia bacterium]|nr:hypothetical protein [Verrucomicrobiota bacterium]